MARPTGTGPIRPRRRAWRGAIALAMLPALATISLIDVRPAAAQKNAIVNFPARPKAPAREGTGLLPTKPNAPGTPAAAPAKEQMLVRADELHYDQTNERVAAVGN